jgi:hypothetical protein
VAASAASRALILDADGVVIKPPRPFSAVRAEELGLDPNAFLPFFQGPFRLALTGRADLEDLIDEYSDLWQ